MEMGDLVLCGVLEELNLDDLVNIVSKEKQYIAKKSQDSLWRGQYCCVPLCCHSSGKQEERKQLFDERLSFHSFLDMATDKERAQQWIAKIRCDPGINFTIRNNTKVCSKHFTPDDFACGGGEPLAPRHVLKKTAIPMEIVQLQMYYSHILTSCRRKATFP